ncbi:uncharacterized protein LOC116275446 [Papio anubis]|uniref:uncharacterized protein LOC116275446 n=1 Tax=Papio anubis TaxID=9555 RepID=UPI0012ADC5ED|nr:uncharacterized protein LOC116275446 [Papio anubis]
MFLGVAQGAKGAAWPRPVSRNPERYNAAACPYPQLPIPPSSTLSPPLASPYGFSMAAADQEHAQRRRKGGCKVHLGWSWPETSGSARQEAVVSGGEWGLDLEI